MSAPGTVSGGPRTRSRPAPTIAEKVRVIGEARIGALLLLAATVAAVVWANAAHDSYEAFWGAELDFGLGPIQLGFSLHHTVNDLLMAVFFFTVGLEVRREFAIGELTSWRRASVPVVAAIAGLVVPALIFVVLNLGSGQVNAWGTVISTDTAFLVGALAIIGPRAPGRLRVFLLALAVVDDIGALSIIAIFYTENFTPVPLLVAAVGLTGIFFVRYLRFGRGLAYVLLAVVVWGAFYASGVHPTLAGVAIALLIPVYRPKRREVEHAVKLARAFGQSPSTEYARNAAVGLRESISINERLQFAFGPYVAYIILPLFALANAGVILSGEILLQAIQSPITWGVILGLVGGKFIGVFGSVAIMHRFKLGEFGPGLTLDRIAGGALLCGIGFTISLFIVELAIEDSQAQNDARVGVLAASVIAFALAAIVFRLSDRRRPKHDPGDLLARPVDPARDHIMGPVDAPFTLVEYGDYECPFCLRAAGTIDDVRKLLGDNLRYVWRHAPLEQVHPNAMIAAEAAEAAGRQGEYFEYGKRLFADQEHLAPEDLVRRAEQLGLDVEQFERDLADPDVIGRVQDDLLDAEAMDITVTPTFYVNGKRHRGPWDARTLVTALRATPVHTAPAPLGPEPEPEPASPATAEPAPAGAAPDTAQSPDDPASKPGAGEPTPGA